MEEIKISIEEYIDELTMLKQIKLKLQEKNIPIETLLAEFNRLEDLEDDKEQLIQENKELKEKNKELNNKILNFINNELPDDEICECCSNYDVNGVRLKNELKKLLEEGE